MKKVQSVVAALAMALTPIAWAAAAKTTLTIKGMTCGGCVAAVKLQLKETEGVTAYEVSLEKGEAEVAYDPGKTDPKKVAASVSKTGFQTIVKGEEKEGAGPASDGSMHKLHSGELQDWFNASNGSVRVISLLSPTCPACQGGHGVLKTVFGKTTSSDLKAFLVWLPMRPGDDPQAAVRQAATFKDPRLTEGWDAAREVGDLFARRLAPRDSLGRLPGLRPRPPLGGHRASRPQLLDASAEGRRRRRPEVVPRSGPADPRSPGAARSTGVRSLLARAGTRHWPYEGLCR